MKPSELRRIRIRALIATRYNGNQAAFAAAIGRSPSQVNRWFMTSEHKRDIGEAVARDIEAKLELPRLFLDADAEQPLEVRQPLQLYSIAPDEQARLLALYDRLTHDQRSQFIDELEALVRANEAVVREVGPRLNPPTDAYVGKFLPKAPTRPGIRQGTRGDGEK